MNRDPYATALNNALTEIQKAYPDITHSFIFNEDGSTIAGETENDPKLLNKVSDSFEELKTKAKSIGNITSYSVNCENGKLNMTNVNGMYLMLVTNSNADDAQIYSLTHVVIPPLMKTLQSFAGQTSAPSTQQNRPVNTPNDLGDDQTKTPSHLQPQTTMNLIVNPLSGFFDGDSVQVDEKTLDYWSDNDADGEEIEQVKIQTPEGQATICKVKKITVGNMKGKGFIRMPAKVCSALNVKGGDRVNVSPKL
jgi:predicted regulator of Ras-like GTPase activity (Roadblock/LC7/MglB family)